MLELEKFKINYLRNIPEQFTTSESEVGNENSESGEASPEQKTAALDGETRESQNNLFNLVAMGNMLDLPPGVIASGQKAWQKFQEEGEVLTFDSALAVGSFLKIPGIRLLNNIALFAGGQDVGQFLGNISGSGLNWLRKLGLGEFADSAKAGVERIDEIFKGRPGFMAGMGSAAQGFAKNNFAVVGQEGFQTTTSQEANQDSTEATSDTTTSDPSNTPTTSSIPASFQTPSSSPTNPGTATARQV